MRKTWLWRKPGLVLMGGAVLSKSLIQFSVDGQGCVPSLLFDLRPNCWPTPPLETPGHSQANLGQSLVGSLLLSSGSWYAQGSSVCAVQESVSPVLCRFWWLYGGVNGDLLQGGLCHIQVWCTQSPYHWGSPLLTCTSTGDSQTQFCLSLCGTEYILWNAKLEWRTSWNQDCREK